MKKLFISCPMRGRTQENIKKSMEKMHKLAEIIFDEELEVIPSFIEDNPPENVNERVWFLGESIKLLSKADYFIGINSYSNFFNGCNIEREIAGVYGIKSTYIGMEIIPDAVEIERNYMNSQDCFSGVLECNC